MNLFKSVDEVRNALGSEEQVRDFIEAHISAREKRADIMLCNSLHNPFNSELNYVTLALQVRKNNYQFVVTKFIAGKSPEVAIRTSLDVAIDLYECFVNQTASLGCFVDFIKENYKPVKSCDGYTIVDETTIDSALSAKKLHDITWEMFYMMMRSCIQDATSTIMAEMNLFEDKNLKLWEIKKYMELPILCFEEDEWVMYFECNGISVSYTVDLNYDIMFQLFENAETCWGMDGCCDCCDCDYDCEEDEDICKEGNVYRVTTSDNTTVVIVKNGTKCGFDSEEIEKLNSYYLGLKLTDELEEMLKPSEIPAAGLVRRPFLEGLRDMYVELRMNGMMPEDAKGQALREATYRLTGKYYFASDVTANEVVLPTYGNVEMMDKDGYLYELTREDIENILYVAKEM